MSSLQPHRGTLVLVLGILGIVICFICGIVAWRFGATDLKAMNEGRMDPSGKGLTQAGWILGIIGTILGSLVVVIWLGMMLIGILSAAAGGGR